MYHFGYQSFIPGIPFWGLIEFFVWAILIYLFTIFVLRIVNRDRDVSDEEESDDALSILRKRYAKGEITKKEFLEIKKDIT